MFNKRYILEFSEQHDFLIAKNYKTLKCPSTVEWLHCGIFTRSNTTQKWQWTPYNYKWQCGEVPPDVILSKRNQVQKSKYGEFPGSPVIKTPCFHCKGVQVQPLVGELRSRKLLGVMPKKKKKLSMIWFHIQEVDKQEAITSGNRRLKYIWGLWEWRGGSWGLESCCFSLTWLGARDIDILVSCILIHISISVQFSRSVMSDCLQPHESQHARPPCPSSTPRVHSDSRPSSWWCHPAISSSVVPFSSCPQSLPASESFPMS